MKGWDVLEGLACTWRRGQWEDGKVGMYLQKGFIWGILERKFNEKMERLGVLESEFTEILEGLDVLQGKFNEKMEGLGCI